MIELKYLVHMKLSSEKQEIGYVCQSYRHEYNFVEIAEMMIKYETLSLL